MAHKRHNYLNKYSTGKKEAQDCWTCNQFSYNQKADVKVLAY